MSEAVSPRRRGADRLLTVSTGPLLLVTAFLVFVCHNGYALYRPEMLACLGALTALGVVLGALMAVDAIVIVHGDHGSRLFVAQPQASSRKEFQPSAYIDAFSTLFAIKLPGQPSRYDDRLLPPDRLLQSVAKWNRIADGTAWAGPPVVNVPNRSQPM